MDDRMPETPGVRLGSRPGRGAQDLLNIRRALVWPQLQPDAPLGHSMGSRIKVTEGANWQRMTFRTRQSFGRDLLGMAGSPPLPAMRRIDGLGNSRTLPRGYRRAWPRVVVESEAARSERAETRVLSFTEAGSSVATIRQRR
jgi:hypothetical protein